MRSILAISAVLVAFSAAPAAARDYPWCARTSSNGFNGDCSFTSFNQCMATVSGQRGECLQNPRFAYGQQTRGRRGQAAYRDGGQNDGWNNGWNNNGWNNGWQGPGYNNRW
jgi:hypothetical protein